MKLSTLINPEFQETVAKLAKAELPLASAFKLKGITKRIDEEFNKYEEIRKKALTQYGEKDENDKLITQENGSVKFSEEGMKAFVVDINELLKTEVEMPKLKISELGNKVTLSANEVLTIEDIIEE